MQAFIITYQKNGIKLYFGFDSEIFVYPTEFEANFRAKLEASNPTGMFIDYRLEEYQISAYDWESSHYKFGKWVIKEGKLFF